MSMQGDYDVLVIGGGPAGLSAAIKAKELGLTPLLIENREILGGIPLQCIHTGFGIHYFKEDLTGTELTYRLLGRFEKLDIDCYTGAHVTDFTSVSYLEKKVRIITAKGILDITAPTIIYAAGARERHLFDIRITGYRSAGIYTAGEAQTMMDIEGIMPGREIVIVGSGDVGLIMARRFALEGARVKAVIETMPYPGGLLRNIVQCLYDFNIPLYLNTSVTRIIGKKRVEKVIISQVDDDLRPVAGTKREIECDTVIIAAGLRPYLPLLESKDVMIDPATGGPIVNDYLETSIPGVFASGNALVINDLVDHVLEQGERAAEGAYTFIKNKGLPTVRLRKMVKGRNVRLIIPQYLSGDRDAIIYARAIKPMRNVAVCFPELEKKITLPAVRPAEMIRVKLGKNEIAKSKSKIRMEIIPYE